MIDEWFFLPAGTHVPHAYLWSDVLPENIAPRRKRYAQINSSKTISEPSKITSPSQVPLRGYVDCIDWNGVSDLIFSSLIFLVYAI
jgi:hypothetical protein